MKSNEIIYQEYLSELQKDIISRYYAQNRKASGRFESEMMTQVTESKMILLGAEHSVFVEKGRGSGKFPPIKAIEEWIEVKQGLPQIFKEKKKQYAFLIARKISRQGTEGSDVLESAIQDFVDKKMFKMLDEIGDNYAVRIQNDIVRLIKKFT